MPLVDDLGTPVPSGEPARRVVSLVPSLTEAIVSVRPEALVGATDWCTRPEGLDVPRVRGTKNPDVRKIVSLVPDLVIANQEENRALDVTLLRDAGLRVWVTRIESVPEAVGSMGRLFDLGLGWPRPAWLGVAAEQWCGDLPPVALRVAVPIWRDPWMVVGSRTFTGDLLRRLGADNVFSDHGERYPNVGLDALDGAGADLVLLPDEPYVFAADDGPEAFAVTPTRLVQGRLLTWYGPSLLEATRLRF